MQKLSLIVLSAAIIILGAGYVATHQRTPVVVPAPGTEIADNSGSYACTMEAKLCPDGSYVGRSGPKCEFAQCPSGPVAGSGDMNATTAALNQRILDNGIYITPLKVIEDSRCATDVQCIWAGRLTVNTKLENKSTGETKEIIFTAGPYQTAFAGKNISLVEATPAKNSKHTIASSEYRFTFSVTTVTPASANGTVKGRVTVSPTCPVERNPPDPSCAPGGYATSIAITHTGSTAVIKTIQTDASGNFQISLPAGTYTLQARGGGMSSDADNARPVWPICGQVDIQIKANQTATADISCDSGIR